MELEGQHFASDFQGLKAGAGHIVAHLAVAVGDALEHHGLGAQVHQRVDVLLHKGLVHVLAASKWRPR